RCGQGLGLGPFCMEFWNEVTRLFRAGMPLRKHRQNFRHYSSCFTASAAVDWLHQLLRSNSNFGPDVTRQQTVQLLKKFLKNHVIEDVKGRWGTEDLEDNNTLYRWAVCRSLLFSFLPVCLHLQRILGVASFYEVLDPHCVNPQNIIHNMTKVNKHGVVTLDDKNNDLPHWVLSAMKSLANWPKYDTAQPSYPGFERDVFKTVSDYFYSLPQPLLTYELYELFINVLGVLQPQCERVAIEALQLCTLLLPPSSRRKLQLLMRMMSRISQNVDMPRLHPAIGTRTLMVHTFSGCVLGSAEECDLDELLATRLVSFLMDHQQSILSVPEYLLSAISDHIQYLRTVPIDSVSNTDGGDPVCAPVPIYAFCHQISCAEFEEQKLASSQKAMEELLEILLTDQNISEKDRHKKLKQFQKQYPDIYRRRFPSSDKETNTDNKPKIKPPLLNFKKTKAFSIRT
uniref:DEP domain containing 1a n=1 Tax=Acanthochromis polyacanthus TaxID=80966 RepID=A0A3Q1FLK3_9TELE